MLVLSCCRVAVSSKNMKVWDEGVEELARVRATMKGEVEEEKKEEEKGYGEQDKVNECVREARGANAKSKKE